MGFFFNYFLKEKKCEAKGGKEYFRNSFRGLSITEIRWKS